MPRQQPDASLRSFARFGELLKFLRRRARMTQRELAIEVGYSEVHISRFEGSQRPPDEQTLLALFVPALDLADEPELVAELLQLARQARGEATPPAPTAAISHAAPPPILDPLEPIPLLPSYAVARTIAESGLASVHTRMRWSPEGGEELPLGAAVGGATGGPSDLMETERIEGRGEPEPALTIPYHGRRLAGDDLRRQIDAWVAAGVVEPSLRDDPYPLWKRMRDEAPVWHNDRHDFYVLTRFHDIEAAHKEIVDGVANAKK